jgi:hypothetical protein
MLLYLKHLDAFLHTQRRNDAKRQNARAIDVAMTSVGSSTHPMCAHTDDALAARWST